jgi:hypothetical protein
MIRHFLYLSAQLVSVLSLAAPTHAANTLSPALPVTETLTVQPIIVCDNAGANCAPSSGLGSYETMANTIYNQAGIGIAFATPEHYNNSALLDPQADTTGVSVFDTAHDLVRLAGHGQSTDPNTLNLWLVDNLVSTTNGVPNGKGVYGFGLIGGNGAIIATAPDANGRVAAIDTMAHEIGHNLGLSHVDSPPLTGALAKYDTSLNLMNTGSRTIPTSYCQVGPYTCTTPPAGSTLAPKPTNAGSSSGATTLTFASTTGVVVGMVAIGAGIPAGDTVTAVSGTQVTLAKPVTGVGSGASVTFARQTDELAPFQLSTVQAPPIFTELPNVFVGLPGGNFVEAIGTLGFSSATPTGLTAAKFRFSDPSTRFLASSGSCATSGAETTTPVGSHVELDLAFSPPFTQGTGSQPVCYTNGLTATPAYSTEYDFSNGATSRAGFDSTGGACCTYTSQGGAVFGFDPTTPGLPTGPSYLPTSLGAISPVTGLPVVEDTDPAWSTPRDIASFPTPFQALDSAPEPAGIALLAPALGVLGLVRRKHASISSTGSCRGYGRTLLLRRKTFAGGSRNAG